ncbi:hypothetical protein CVIRNUC_002548 [Coccomyxa viridis]|uniref:Uncharacterized protein n=1 Tax=Coccomyxa viridis TaxID=1274662 RepID=A0AAV1HXK9_9CHLO|nr:hypothetical protein CVIRNUC_002548 [Coccomyxa viridis]
MTVQNAYVCVALFQEREKEWAMEQQQASLDRVLPVLQSVARGCQVQDRAFWPQRLSCAVPHVSAALTEANNTSAAPEDDDEALGVLGVLDRWPPSGHVTQAADMDMKQRDLQGSHSSSSTALEEGASIAAPSLHPCTSLALWASDGAGQIAEHSRARLDLMADQGMSLLRRTMPLPCMEVSRRSALRMRVQWHGLTWPPVKPEVLQTCEVYL